jgi:NAD-dependent deacetylase
VPALEFPPDLITALQNAGHIAALTGAGVSAESGVPTFRDSQTGLWAQYDPQDLATPEAFRRDPKLVWEWYAWRRELIAKTYPNLGHLALAEMEAQLNSAGRRLTLITQNVDGLHHMAGNENVIELHGNIQRTKCFAENIPIDDWPDLGEVPPNCPRCGGYLRPDVVWFGEAMPVAEWRAASEAAWTCDVFFSIGTSALVQPAASLPYRALERGATVVEINPEETSLSQQTGVYSLRGKSGEILPALVEAVWQG